MGSISSISSLCDFGCFGGMCGGTDRKRKLEKEKFLYSTYSTYSPEEDSFDFNKIPSPTEYLDHNR